MSLSRGSAHILLGAVIGAGILLAGQLVYRAGQQNPVQPVRASLEVPAQSPSIADVQSRANALVSKQLAGPVMGWGPQTTTTVTLQPGQIQISPAMPAGTRLRMHITSTEPVNVGLVNAALSAPLMDRRFPSDFGLTGPCKSKASAFAELDCTVGADDLNALLFADVRVRTSGDALLQMGLSKFGIKPAEQKPALVTVSMSVYKCLSNCAQQ